MEALRELPYIKGFTRRFSWRARNTSAEPFSNIQSKMSEDNFYVYGLYKEGSSLPFYIGKGKGKRMYKHLCESVKGNNPHKDRKIEKLQRNGNPPEAKIIKDGLSEKKAYDLEYLLVNIHYEDLTNIEKSWGAGVGSETVSGKNNPMYGKTRNFSEETKEKMGKAFRGKTLSEKHKQKISEAHEGKTHSEEVKKRLSEIHKGKTLSEEHKKKMSKAHEGEKSSSAKLTKEKASEIKWLALNSNKTQKEIGNKYGITKNSVSNIKLEKTWSHINAKKPS